MWDMERYISLLLGEIPRLRDDSDGYGPNGKNYLAHIDIPDSVTEAFENLTAGLKQSSLQSPIFLPNI